MARPLRLEIPGAVWHVTSRGNERKNIFRNDTDRRLLLEFLGEAAKRYGWIIDTYVLMSPHPLPRHAVAQWQVRIAFLQASQAGRASLSGPLQKLLVEEETRSPAMSHPSLRRPQSRPRRDGEAPREEYRWSSYRAIAGYEEAPSWLATDRVLGRIRSDRKSAQQIYRE
ncbi:MAG: hypothetical protein ABI718_00005 [Acidobacteriota bacterium]